MKGRWLVALSNRKGPLSLKPLLASGGVSHISLRIEKQCAEKRSCQKRKHPIWAFSTC